MSPQAQAFWTHFKAANPSVSDAQLYEVAVFGDSESLADELSALVVAGTKRATASSLRALQAENMAPPQPGDFSVVTTWAGLPLCVIKTLSVDIVPFDQVSAEFAATEGEGDGSLAFWRAAHRGYFERECQRLGLVFSEDMPIACERFEVVGLAASPS